MLGWCGTAGVERGDASQSASAPRGVQAGANTDFVTANTRGRGGGPGCREQSWVGVGAKKPPAFLCVSCALCRHPPASTPEVSCAVNAARDVKRSCTYRPGGVLQARLHLHLST